MSAIKERPILFSASMVRAILEGRKTVTRRVVKIQPRSKADIGSYGLGQPFIRNPDVARPNPECPYGRPGDRLWVRESFWHAGDWVPTYPEDDEGSWYGTKRVHYRADGTPPNEPNNHYPKGLKNGAYSAAEPAKIWRARPNIHMPRWASRILLEIAAVRVERLQDISDAQAEAEGIDLDALADGQARYDMCHAGSGAEGRPTLLSAWRDLWQSINGSESWDANPWVWVVEFKQVTQ